MRYHELVRLDLTVAMAAVLAAAPACRRDKPDVQVIELHSGARFELPASATPSRSAGARTKSFVVANQTVLDVDSEPMKESCQDRLAWIEQRTADEIEKHEIEAEEPMTRKTLGGRQVIYARLATVLAGKSTGTAFQRTEMFGVCGDGEFLIFQLNYRGMPDRAVTQLLTDAVVSLRY